MPASRTPAQWRGTSGADMCTSCRSRPIGQDECALRSRQCCTCRSSVSAGTGSEFNVDSMGAINTSTASTTSRPALTGTSVSGPRATLLSPAQLAPAGAEAGAGGTTASNICVVRLGWDEELERNYGDSDSSDDEAMRSSHTVTGNGGGSPTHGDSFHSMVAVIEPAASRTNTAGVLARDSTSSVLGSGSYGTRGMSSLWSRTSLDSVDDAASVTGCRPPSPAAVIGSEGNTAATSPVSITALRPSRRTVAQHRVAGQRFDVDSATCDIVVDMLAV